MGEVKDLKKMFIAKVNFLWEKFKNHLDLTNQTAA